MIECSNHDVKASLKTKNKLLLRSKERKSEKHTVRHNKTKAIKHRYNERLKRQLFPIVCVCVVGIVAI